MPLQLLHWLANPLTSAPSPPPPHTLPSASTPLLPSAAPPPAAPDSYLRDLRLALQGSLIESETPIVPPQAPGCPNMLMTSCQCAYKQNDLTYCNYRSHQSRNENSGGRGGAVTRRRTRSAPDVFGTFEFCFFVLYFSKMFFFLFTGCTSECSLPRSHRRPAGALSPPLLFLLHTASMCLFYLAADSL